MFGDKYNNETNRSFKNHIRNIHGKATGFYRGVKSKIARPTVDHNVKGQVNKQMMKGLTGYEQIRNRVMETPEAPIQNRNQVASGVKKSKVSAGL
jgi:hypothetical protein